MQAEDERDCDDGVDPNCEHGDEQRRAGVLQPAEHPHPSHGDECGRHAEGDDAQVGDGVGRDLRRGAQRLDEGLRGQCHRGTEHHAEPEPERHALDALRHRGPEPTLAEAPRDRGRGGVGQEDAQPEHGAEQVRCGPEPGEGKGAERADDGGVDQDVERLGDQGPERWNGEGEDLA